MMFSNMPPYEIVNELRKSRVADKHDSLVLVEGTTDRALLSSYQSQRCQLFPAQSKERVVDVLDMANVKTQLGGIAGIIDADLWLIEDDKRLKIINLLYDNVPDIELVLLRSSALEKALRNTITEYSSDRIAALAFSLRNESLRLAADFGYFRLYHYRHPKSDLKLRVVAEALPSYMDIEAIAWHSEKIADSLTSGSRRLTAAYLLEQIARLREKVEPGILLCRGKDALSILAALLPTLYRRAFGNDDWLDVVISQFQITPQNHEIARILRMNYEFEDFKHSELCKRVRSWESANNPYRILKPEF
ncbi:MAG: DUF4435 domain-containing protein [Chloroflexi bacterium]|nr:DUF4435 domain-containing protein [Chloroflexota bacterium]